MKRDDVIGKIKKLLALAADNANEHECVAAALKAQALIAEYDVEDFELADELEPIIEGDSYIGKGKAWRWFLAVTVAENFRCKAYHHTNKGREAAAFLGYKTDADAARLTYEHLFKIGDRLANRESRKVRDRLGTAKGAYNTYTYGFVEGVKRELEKQSQALLIVCPPKVSEAYDEIDFSRSAPNRSWFDGTVAPDLYGVGKRDGRDAVRSTRLGEAHGSIQVALQDEN